MTSGPFLLVSICHTSCSRLCASRLHPDAAVPPWVGYNEEETIQQQILALSAVRPNPLLHLCLEPAPFLLLNLRTVISGQKKLPAGPSCRRSVSLWHGAHVSSSCSDAGRRPAAKPHALWLGSQTVSRQTAHVLALFTLFPFIPQAYGLLTHHRVLVRLTAWRKRFSGGIISTACLWSSSRLSSQNWQPSSSSSSSSSSRMLMREGPACHRKTPS